MVTDTDLPFVELR